MAIISGVMQMAGTGDQVDDIGDARSAISSLLGIPESVIFLHSFHFYFPNKQYLRKSAAQELSFE